MSLGDRHLARTRVRKLTFATETPGSSRNVESLKVACPCEPDLAVEIRGLLRPPPKPPDPTLSRCKLDEVQQNRQEQRGGPEIYRRAYRPAAGFEYFARIGVEPASGQLRNAEQ